MKHAGLALGFALVVAATAGLVPHAAGQPETASIVVPVNRWLGHQQEFGLSFNLSTLPPMQVIHSAALVISAGHVDSRLGDPVLCGPRQQIGWLNPGDGQTVLALGSNLGGSASFEYLRLPTLAAWVVANEMDTVLVTGEWWETIYCHVYVSQTCYEPRPRYCNRYICDFELFGICFSGHWERYQCGIDYIPYECGYWTDQVCDHRYHPPVYEDRPGSLYLSWARLDVVFTPPACPADMNQDGGVDGEDVNAFFAVWEAGEALGDLNADGGVDFADVSFFFDHWENGC